MKHKKSIGMLLVVCMMMFAYGCGKKEAGGELRRCQTFSNDIIQKKTMTKSLRCK